MNHPVRGRVAGTVESISHITADTLYQCHKAFYRPGNMVLCAAGNIDPQRVADIAREVLTAEHTTAAETDHGKPERPEVGRNSPAGSCRCPFHCLRWASRGPRRPEGGPAPAAAGGAGVRRAVQHLRAAVQPPV